MLDVSRDAGCCLVPKSKGFGLEQMSWVGESKEMAVGSPSHVWHVTPTAEITLSREPSSFLIEDPCCLDRIWHSVWWGSRVVPNALSLPL